MLKLPNQSFLDEGKGTFDTVNALKAYMGNHDGALPPDVAHPPSLKEQEFGPGTHEVARNGYTFTIDGAGRTREVEGTITVNPDQGRSRTAQA